MEDHAKFFVATYGNMGLIIEFFCDRESLNKAVEEAEEQYKVGDVDEFTWGDCK